MKPYGVIYEFRHEAWKVTPVPEENLVRIEPIAIRRKIPVRLIGMAMLAISFGGIIAPLTQKIRLETSYYLETARSNILFALKNPRPLPPAVPTIFNPLLQPDGTMITPADNTFSVIIPKIGVNAPVIPSVNPAEPNQYLEALKRGVAHASTSYFPDQDGTVYLFSHSTNYDWFVKDLNAVFYLLKNLNTGDTIVLVYKGKVYTYRLTEKRVVTASQVSYMVGQTGTHRLILQTCWPPGSTAERLLLFADLISEQNQVI